MSVDATNCGVHLLLSGSSPVPAAIRVINPPSDAPLALGGSLWPPLGRGVTPNELGSQRPAHSVSVHPAAITAATHQRMCLAPLRGHSATTRYQRCRAPVPPASVRVLSTSPAAHHLGGVWRRLRLGWTMITGGSAYSRVARWRSWAVRSAEASHRHDQTRGGCFVGCAALAKRQEKRTARWWHRAGLRKGDGGGR